MRSIQVKDGKNGMDKSKLSIGVNIDLDMQSYYDNIVLYRDCLDAQIKVLEQSPQICKHKTLIDGFDGTKFCVCCHKLVDGGPNGHTQTR